MNLFIFELLSIIYYSWIATLAEATAVDHDEETPPVEADLLAQMATSSGTHGPGHRRQAVERAEGLCAVEHKSSTGEHEPRAEADAVLSGSGAAVVYRPMRPTDLPQVKQLHEECFPIRCYFIKINFILLLIIIINKYK
jgi:hypothetical protein